MPINTMFRIEGQTVVDEINRLCDLLSKRLSEAENKEQRGQMFAVQTIAIGVLFQKMLDELDPDLHGEYKTHVEKMLTHVRSSFTVTQKDETLN